MYMEDKMGRTIYLSEKEIAALRNTAGEWREIMGTGDKESNKCVEERMRNGLGSALRKLYKGCRMEQVYEEY